MRTQTEGSAITAAGKDPGFFLGGGALFSCSTSTPVNHIFFFFLQNASCIRKPQVISEGGGAPLRSPPMKKEFKKTHEIITPLFA